MNNFSYRAVAFALSACSVLTYGLLFSTGAQAQAVDYAKSQLTFAAKQMNVPIEGKFGKFTANIDWNAAKPEASRADLTIDVNSFDLGQDDFNDEAKGKDWFNAKSFPQARFVSSAVKALGGGKFEVAGKLTIKGHTHDITAPFTVKAEGASQSFEGTLSIKRLQYGIGEGSWSDTSTVADDVQVRFKIVTGAAPAAAPKKK
jgi:polyisoprenoid-binding protein YceI